MASYLLRAVVALLVVLTPAAAMAMDPDPADVLGHAGSPRIVPADQTTDARPGAAPPDAARPAPRARRPPKRPPTIPPGDLSAATIRWGRCCQGTYGPAYRIELRGDGSGVYDGEEKSLVHGRHAFQIPAAAAQGLIAQFLAAGFWDLRADYNACGPAHVPRYEVSLKVGRATRTVKHSCGMLVGYPSEILKLELALLAAADERRWLIGTPETLAQLEAEGFDFRSVQAADMAARGMSYSPGWFLDELLARGSPMAASDGPLVAYAIEAERLDQFHALVARGAFNDPGAKEAAMFAAILARRPELLAEILRSGPDLAQRHRDLRRTALELSIEAESFKEEPETPMVSMLLAVGADPNQPKESGASLLHDAYDPHIVRALAAAGADLERRNEDGETPLLSVRTEEAALALLQAGADTNARDARGRIFKDVALAYEWAVALSKLPTP